MSYKMYVWEDVLCDWSCGMIVAYAESVEQAREIVRKEHEEYIYAETHRDPIEISGPAAFYVYGGG